jgi:hypothetical protein
VDASLASFCRRPLEVFHHVRDIDISSIDSSFPKSVVQKMSSRPDKGVPFAIFSVPRLLPHHHVNSAGFSFAEHCLCSVSPKIARLAFSRGIPEVCERDTRITVSIVNRRGALRRMNRSGSLAITGP